MRKVLSTLILAFIASIAINSAAQIPSVSLKDINGNTVNTATLSNDGKPFVISFFATWCKPCLRELRSIAEVYEDWQDETGVKMILVSIDEAQNANKVKPLVNAEGWDFDVLLDVNSDLFHALGLQSVPHVLVCDGDGNIVYSHSGYTDGSEEHIIEIVRNHSK
ncbi:MAG: TlpA family protein disulfide reductase [Muribaculaceae bacterium]